MKKKKRKKLRKLAEKLLKQARRAVEEQKRRELYCHICRAQRKGRQEMVWTAPGTWECPRVSRHKILDNASIPAAA